jgi:hypothetical protein
MRSANVNTYGTTVWSRGATWRDGTLEAQSYESNIRRIRLHSANIDTYGAKNVVARRATTSTFVHMAPQRAFNMANLFFVFYWRYLHIKLHADTCFCCLRNGNLTARAHIKTLDAESLREGAKVYCAR